MTVHSYLHPCPAARKYQKQHLVFTACAQRLNHLKRSAEDFACVIPGQAQQCATAINRSIIQGMTGHRGGVGVKREVRHRTLASATPGSNHKSVSSCISETSVHLLLICPFGGCQNMCKVATLIMIVHSKVNTSSLFRNACYGLDTLFLRKIHYIFI